MIRHLTTWLRGLFRQPPAKAPEPARYSPTAQQGHRYQYGLRQVLALETGQGMVKVRVIDEREHPATLGRAFYAHAAQLVPAPMKYFGNVTP